MYKDQQRALSRWLVRNQSMVLSVPPFLKLFSFSSLLPVKTSPWIPMQKLFCNLFSLLKIILFYFWKKKFKLLVLENSIMFTRCQHNPVNPPASGLTAAGFLGGWHWIVHVPESPVSVLCSGRCQVCVWIICVCDCVAPPHPPRLFTTYITNSWNPQAAVSLYPRGQREGADQINWSYSLSKVQTFLRGWTSLQTDLGSNPVIAITIQESLAVTLLLWVSVSANGQRR